MPLSAKSREYHRKKKVEWLYELKNVEHLGGKMSPIYCNVRMYIAIMSMQQLWGLKVWIQEKVIKKKKKGNEGMSVWWWLGEKRSTGAEGTWHKYDWSSCNTNVTVLKIIFKGRTWIQNLLGKKYVSHKEKKESEVIEKNVTNWKGKDIRLMYQIENV